jgi:hypothetical protein
MGAYEFVNILVDSDHDGLADGDEQRIGTSLLNSDTDADGSSDGDEEVAGTDPLDANSVFEVDSVQPLVGGGFEVAFDTISGRTYAVYYKDHLEDAWTVLQDNIAGTGSSVSVTDSGTASARFYQVRVSR